MHTISILFFCSSNSTRSYMAERFARAVAPRETLIVSTAPDTEIHPFAVDAIREHGITPGINQLTKMSDIEDKQFDIVITLCSTVEKGSDAFKGMPVVLHWNIDNPEQVTGPEEFRKQAFNKCADSIMELVNTLFNQGYYLAFSQLKQNTDNILNSLSEGILAHDLDRKIFFFSERAAALTGLSAESVIGKDCHEIFPGGFCGEQCSFCDGFKTNRFINKTYPISFSNSTGDRKECDLSVVPLKNEKGTVYGVAASLRDNSELNQLKVRNKELNSFRGIIGNDPKMLDVFQQITDVADYNFPVHIFGETGTGKELVAAAIHNESPRKNKPFVPVNCGALPETLIESELFGHVRGAFSGAVKDKKGRFELAEGGTIFLDEIGELSKEMQVKLLRFLQEGTFEKVGGEKTITADVRVISATNRDLKKEVTNNAFREDVYYRLNVIPVMLPPLRDKINDIPLLTSHFLKKISDIHHTSVPDFSEEAIAAMMGYNWPGNVRELENAIQYSIVRARGKTILPEHLPIEFSVNEITGDPAKRGPSKKLNIDSVRQALSQAGGNKSKAAKLLCVGRATLYRFLDDYGDRLS